MNIYEITQKLKNNFQSKQLKEIATKCNFIIRIRKITPAGLLKNFMFTAMRDGGSSLQSLSSLFDDDGVSVSKQALSKKITKNGVEFFKQILENLCEQFIGPKFIGTKSKFTDVVVVDSTEIKLNKNLIKFKQSRNGPKCKAQTTYGLLSNNLYCEITKSNKNDQGYKNYLNYIKKDND